MAGCNTEQYCGDPIWAGVPCVYDEATATTYVNRAGATGSGKGTWITCFSVSCLRHNRMWAQRSGATPCGNQNVGISPGKVQLATTGVGLGSGLAGSIGTLGGIGAATTASLIAAPIGIVLSIFGGIFAHHAQAVQREQDTICAVAYSWNAFADAMEQQIKKSQISLQDALTQLQTAYQQLLNALSGIENSGQQNAGWGYHKCLDALYLFNKEKIYPSLVPGIPAGALGGGNLTTTALAVGGGLLGAKVLGVF